MSAALILLVAGVFATHPAGNPGARMLTVAESVGQGQRSVTPEQVPLFWTADSQLTKERPESEPPTWSLPVPEGPGIVYGESVSRNEFGIDGGVFPAPDGQRLAVYRKDESAVTLYPLYDITSRTGGAQLIRYPMAGMASEHVSVCVTDLNGNILSTLQVSDFDEERYLTGVTWSPEGKYLFVQVLDRAQHEMHLNMYRTDDGSFVRTVLTEHNDAWIEPLDPIYFVKGSYEFLYRTDNRDGYRNLYRCDTLGHVERFTAVDADVAYVANDGKYVYYTSAEVSPVENHLFRMPLRKRLFDKKPRRLTPEEGWHRISMSPDCSKFIDRYSSFNVPGVTQVRAADGKLLEHVLTALDPLDEYAQCQVELGTTPSADGLYDNYYRLFYPRDFDPARKYPLIVYVYGGPHSQMVNDSWLGGIRMWEMLMAQRGYVVYVQDNRGTQNRGAAFEKAINRRCGTAEVEDQMAGIHALLDRAPWIDRSRIGVHGWSYGGFMTLSLATRNPGFFKVAVAGGPVIDWQWYEVMYGERYMDTPLSNPEGFAEASLIPRAKDLTGRVLICQGVLDGTVVPQHSLSFVQACIEEGVPVDWFPYPMDEHNMRGKARVHLYEKITDYFEQYL
jgi:dipeptidyl-peptidase-4